MSKLNITTQITLLKEARMYLKDVKIADTASIVEQKKDDVVLTEEHLIEWLEVFYDDRIMMGTCNEASVKM